MGPTSKFKIYIKIHKNTQKLNIINISSYQISLQYVVGVSFPVILADPHRSFAHYYNLQIQYASLPRPLYWWNFYNSSTFAARRQQRQLTEAAQVKLHPNIKHDASREFIYEGIEQIFERYFRCHTNLFKAYITSLSCRFLAKDYRVKFVCSKLFVRSPSCRFMYHKFGEMI